MKLTYIMILLAASLMMNCTQQKPVAAPPQKLPVVKVKQQDVPLFRQYVGQIYGLKDIPIRARVEGFLTKIHFEEGMRVRKGDQLYSVDPEQYNAEVSSYKAKLAEARTLLVNAENQLGRVKPLAEINAVSQSDLDYAQANRDAAAAAVNAARSNLKSTEIKLSYCEIYAPIGGFIGKTNAKVGEFVGRDPNPVILNTVSRIDTVRVEFFLTESEYLAVARYVSEMRKDSSFQDRKRPEGNLTLILSDGSRHPYKGNVDYVNRQVDASTGAILVQASFYNPDLILRPGQFARIEAKVSTKKDAIIIPQRCVSELQGQFSVYVVGDSNKVVTKRIEIGEQINDMYWVKSGLVKGEVVVLEGIQKVRSGMIIDPDLQVFESVNEDL
ncbi:MAG: efflux RND transporter periplasmic adaptor subunit [Reichenbachiella sp.]